MPFDVRHPTAPHEKLRLPEWYISNLMMDRALDAICRRVKNIDRKHDVPYLAGYSIDGNTIYIDRHMPRTLKYKGRIINIDRFLLLHEAVEKALIDQLGLHYLHAIRSLLGQRRQLFALPALIGASTIALCKRRSNALAMNA
jgi:hypothetical protein